MTRRVPKPHQSFRRRPIQGNESKELMTVAPQPLKMRINSSPSTSQCRRVTRVKAAKTSSVTHLSPHVPTSSTRYFLDLVPSLEPLYPHHRSPNSPDSQSPYLRLTYYHYLANGLKCCLAFLPSTQYLLMTSVACSTSPSPQSDCVTTKQPLALNSCNS